MTKKQHPTKDECAANGWLCRAELKKERLKPAKGQLPVAMYWQGQGFVGVYDKAQCVAMRPYRAPNTKQLAALTEGRKLLGTRKCKTNECTQRVFTDVKPVRPYCDRCTEKRRKARVVPVAREWLQLDRIVILDTETTGLSKSDQIIEIAVIDSHGRTLLDTYIQPTVPISDEAAAVHGITADLLAGAPRFADVLPSLIKILEAHPVVIYNRDFDTRMIVQSAFPGGPTDDNRDSVHELAELVEKSCSRCLMMLYAEYFGAWNDYFGSYKWQSLGGAAEMEGIAVSTAHRARADCETTLSLLQSLASQAKE